MTSIHYEDVYYSITSPFTPLGLIVIDPSLAPTIVTPV
jgi:hypothetical protein